MIIAAITLFIIAGLFYWLFIEGHGYVMLLMGFGIFGGGVLISKYFPATNAVCATIMSHQISWAYAISSLICVLGLGYFLDKHHK